MQVAIQSLACEFLRWLPCRTKVSRARWEARGPHRQCEHLYPLATKVTCVVLIMTVLLMFQLAGNKVVPFMHILSFTQRAFCWTDMITFHFKQRSPTLANLGVDVAGTYVNKSSIFSVRKTFLTLMSGGK